MNPEDIFGLCNRKNAIFVILCAAAIYVHLLASYEDATTSDHQGHGVHLDAEEERETWCIHDEELSVFRSRCNDVENILSALADAFHVRFPSR